MTNISVFEDALQKAKQLSRSLLIAIATCTLLSLAFVLIFPALPLAYNLVLALPPSLWAGTIAYWILRDRDMHRLSLGGSLRQTPHARQGYHDQICPVFEYDDSSHIPVKARDEAGTAFTGPAHGSHSYVDWSGFFLDGLPHGEFHGMLGDRVPFRATFDCGQRTDEAGQLNQDVSDRV